jgi:acyl-CoA synthetase (AMP-forming)/AMP-acid ligase II
MPQGVIPDLDPSCGGLLPPIVSAEAQPALRDDCSEVWMTRADLRAASLALAEKFASDRKRLVFLLASNNSETVIGLLAAAASGHAIALIDPSFREDKLKALVEAYGPELIVGTRELEATLESVAGAPSRRGSHEAEARRIAWIESSGAASAEINPVLQILLSTSGTTGSQKYVRLSREAIVVNARQIAKALGIDARSTGIGHLPLHYSYGLSVVTSHLVAGARVYLISDSIASPTFWPKIKRVGGSHFPGVPFHYNTLARLGASFVPETIKAFTQAGGALDPRIQATIQQLAERNGGQFFAMYGQTEAAPRMTTLQHADFSRKIGSVGVALPGGKLTIVDQEGVPLAADAIGSVVYEGPNVMLGYATSGTDLDKGDELKGRLETGDLGRLDHEGFLYLTGRTKRFAKISGYRLGLDEIEKDLLAVCPVACLDLGDKIGVVHEQESEAALKARLREFADIYKIPSSSFSLCKVERIPRGGSGKINYAELKEAIGV